VKWLLLLIGLLAAGAWGYTQLTGGPPLASAVGASVVADSPDVIARRIWVAGPGEEIHGPPALDGSVLPITDWTTGDVAVLDLRTNTTRRVTDSPGLRGSTDFAQYSAASPDGRWVAYTWFAENWLWELRVVDVDGGEPRVLIDGERFTFIEPAAWSWDGQWIAAQARRSDGSRQMLLVDAGDGSHRVLRSFPSWAPLGAIAFSPDGRFLLYDVSVDEQGQRDVFILATDASGEQRITTGPGQNRALGWAPDGSSVLYSSNYGESPGVWSVRVANGRRVGEPVLVRDGFWNAFPLGFTRDGTLYYGVMADQFDVHVVDIDPVTYQPVAPPVRVSSGVTAERALPSWSRDGRSLAFKAQSHLSGSTLMIRSLATGETRELRPGLAYFNFIRWSADGRSLLVIGDDGKGRLGIYRIDRQTGSTSLVLRKQPWFHSHEWSAADSVVYLDVRADGAATFVAHHLESGRVDTLHHAPAAGNGAFVRLFDLSPDGRTLATATGSGNAVRVLSVAGGAPRDLVRAAEGETLRYATWSHDGAWVIYTRLTRDRGELWRVPATGGTPERIPLDDTSINGARVHPSGTRIAFTAGRPRMEVWALENIPGAGPAEQPATAAKGGTR
jgi:Tol biopolymer transport system component